MTRRVAMIVHVPTVLIAGVLYFFFVLPRWPELNYETSHSLGTVLRIVAGALIGLAALPVVFNWLRARKPEYGTPQLALTLRVVSIVLHVLGGALIVGTAISEIWLTLDAAGRWLFGIYGAAAAIALLGIATFYLAYVAELPPPPPKPLKAKTKSKTRRTRKNKKAAPGAVDASGGTPSEEDAEKTDADAASDSSDEPSADDKRVEATADAATTPATSAEDGPGGLADSAEDAASGEDATSDDEEAAEPSPSKDADSAEQPPASNDEAASNDETTSNDEAASNEETASNDEAASNEETASTDADSLPAEPPGAAVPKDETSEPTAADADARRADSGQGRVCSIEALRRRKSTQPQALRHGGHLTLAPEISRRSCGRGLAA